MQKHFLEPAPPEITQRPEPASDEAVVCKELLGCPFCGGPAFIHCFPVNYSVLKKLYAAHVECDDCRIATEGRVGESEGEIISQSIAVWNRRQPNEKGQQQG